MQPTHDIRYLSPRGAACQMALAWFPTTCRPPPLQLHVILEELRHVYKLPPAYFPHESGRDYWKCLAQHEWNGWRGSGLPSLRLVGGSCSPTTRSLCIWHLLVLVLISPILPIERVETQVADRVRRHLGPQTTCINGIGSNKLPLLGASLLLPLLGAPLASPILSLLRVAPLRRLTIHPDTLTAPS